MTQTSRTRPIGAGQVDLEAHSPIAEAATTIESSPETQYCLEHASTGQTFGSDDFNYFMWQAQIDELRSALKAAIEAGMIDGATLADVEPFVERLLTELAARAFESVDVDATSIAQRLLGASQSVIEPGSTRVTSNNPLLIGLDIDVSGSMTEKYGDEGISKIAMLEHLINKFLIEIALSTSPTENEMKSRFLVALNAFNAEVQDLLPMTPLNVLMRSENRKGQTQLGEERIIAVPPAGGNTDIVKVLNARREQAVTYCAENPDRPSPNFFLFTDAKDNNDAILTAADQLKAVGNNDGPVTLWTVLLPDDAGKPVIFPTSLEDVEKQLGLAQGSKLSPYIKVMFDSASLMPLERVKAAIRRGLIKPASEVEKQKLLSGEVRIRCFAMNMSPDQIVDTLAIGTQTEDIGAQAEDDAGLVAEVA